MSNLSPKLRGYFKTSSTSVGFVLPIFSSAGVFYAQRTNQSGDRIIGFDKISGKGVIFLSSEFTRPVGINDPAIYLFSYRSDDILFGSKNSILQKVLSNSMFSTLPKTTLVQIERLGGRALDSVHLVEMAESMKKFHGDQTHLSYINSVIRSASWEFIENNFPQVMDEVLKNEELSAIDFSVTSDGVLSFTNHSSAIKFPEQVKADTLKHLQPIFRNINAEVSREREPENEMPLGDVQSEFLRQALLSIGRQEERIAFAIYCLVERGFKLEALRSVAARAKSERTAIQNITGGEEFLMKFSDEKLLRFCVMFAFSNWSTGDKWLLIIYLQKWFGTRYDVGKLVDDLWLSRVGGVMKDKLDKFISNAEMTAEMDRLFDKVEGITDFSSFVDFSLSIENINSEFEKQIWFS